MFERCVACHHVQGEPPNKGRVLKQLIVVIDYFTHLESVVVLTKKPKTHPTMPSNTLPYLSFLYDDTVCLIDHYNHKIF